MTPITKHLVGFCRFARSQGLPVGVQETLDAMEVARLGTMVDKKTFKLALRALLSTSREDRDRFDDLFEAYWARQQRSLSRQLDLRKQVMVVRQEEAIPLLMIGNQAEEEVPEEDGKSTTGASAVERLRQADFSKVVPQDQEKLEQLALRLWKQMSRRMARRLKATHQKQQVHLRRTIRQNIPHGGDLIELRYKGRKPRKPRLVVLLDVSGSMDQYSFFFLRFVYALQQHFQRVDAFVFSTRLTYISDALKARRLPDSLQVLAETADAWSSGTRIGGCLQDFYADYRRMLSRNTLVLILSDGLDTGEPDVLEHALRKIKQRARKLIWLNPLKGMDGYQPLARGIKAALPWVDDFLAAHSLDSLLQLETHLHDV